MQKLKFIFIGLLLPFLIVACSTEKHPDPADVYKDYNAEQLYAEGTKSIKKRRYNEAIKYFEALDSLYPFHPVTEKADSELIYAYYQSEDYPATLAAANRFIRLFPKHPHVDYAYYMKGMADYNQNRTLSQRYLNISLAERDLANSQQAFYDFRDVVQLFPHSPYAADARQRMVHLRNLFAEHELTIAEYYYARKAYVAAANRASYIIAHYQRTPSAKPALELLVKANGALGLKQSQAEARAMLEANK